MTRAVAIVDGEHYPAVVRDALATLPYEVVGALLVGGTEKLRGGEPPDYGVPLVEALDAVAADVVLDLSDEPVLGVRERFLWASRALALGLAYVGADFRFEPPPYEPFALPSLAVVGTGKRVGKTAVTGHVARLLGRDREVVVVAMGRGGPPEPELVRVPPSVAELLARSRSGLHAASDHLETAALSGVTTIGCRRAGGGLAGAPFVDNVRQGAALAASLAPDVVVFDGSGAAIPPLAVDRRILVVARPLAGLDPYRVLVSDLVIQTGGGAELAAEVRALKDVPVLEASLRLQPIVPLAGRRVAVFTTGPAPVDHLDAEIVLVSRNLSDRAALGRDIGRAAGAAEVFLVELKAAAIDVVAEEAARRGIELVLAGNDVVSEGLDEAILALLPQGVAA
jgi:cyclic 2,3-diphosphoglycerate synthetase